MQNNEYENAWGEESGQPGAQPAAVPAPPVMPTDHKPGAPATNAVVEAAKAQRDQDAKNFSDAWNDKPAEQPEQKQPATFKEAFLQARAAGLKEFEWQGKKYVTDLPKVAPVEKPGATPQQGAMPAQKV